MDAQNREKAIVYAINLAKESPEYDVMVSAVDFYSFLTMPDPRKFFEDRRGQADDEDNVIYLHSADQNVQALLDTIQDGD